MNVNAEEFKSKRDAAAIAQLRISDQMELEHDGPQVE